MYTPSFLFMKKILLCLSISVLFLTACNKVEDDPVNPPQDNQIVPLVDGIIPDAVTDYDGNTYDAVRIGEQVWMASNLRTTHYADGTEITFSTEVSDSIALYYYVDNGRELADYGYWYNWRAVMRNSPATNAIPSGVQGICPRGWHVPSNAEWGQLTDYLRSQSQYVCCNNSNDIAKSLASETGWDSYTDSGMEFNTFNIMCCVGNPRFSNNATGFNAFPAGYYGAFYYGCQAACVGKEASYWSTSEHPENNDFILGFSLSYNSTHVCSTIPTKRLGYSVRCVRD